MERTFLPRISLLPSLSLHSLSLKERNIISCTSVEEEIYLAL